MCVIRTVGGVCVCVCEREREREGERGSPYKSVPSLTCSALMNEGSITEDQDKQGE